MLISRMLQIHHPLKNIRGNYMNKTEAFLGRRIRELRKGYGFSQEKLAEVVDVDPRYISRIELGKSLPSLDLLQRIATAVDVETRELFEFEHFTTQPLVMRAEIDLLLEGVDEQERQMILRIFKGVIRAVRGRL